ncbi:venom carboxylesterase-6-like isoform X2 [Zootermopsis nevadensis]|uniref:venom carboxylesterase-6-like isoform X2 n=1 Tax=Zootermopsis nevadensis TaxID=136037 RepID=UPI000B8E71C9|nr:venom carboxylesterase-6-like isoform X2 [Zootermopsis nevadensis]
MAEGECDHLKTIEVTVKDGTLRGTSLTSEKGRPFCVFLGIPYAQPPVGNLRFKPPQPVIPWQGVLSSTKDAADCMQPPPPFTQINVSEDCLYLNVYTPKLKTLNGTLLPVIVFISGGAFYMSSGSINTYKPQLFMDKDVLLVTFNYRVSAFGFLSTGDDESPGNYGMKDQVAVLRWVHDNIKEFGGDPNSVTIMGQSAGSASVHYHMLSPTTRGLFHNAISMDGTLISPWARSDNPEKIAKKLARLVNCPTEPSADLVECLRQRPATDLTDTIYKLCLFFILVTPGYAPVVEKHSERNLEPYLTQDPLQLILNGSFQQVPWLMGSNSQSSVFFFVTILNNPMLLNQLNENFEFILPNMMLPESMEPEQKQLSLQGIFDFYGLDHHKLRVEQEMQFIDMTTDRFFMHGTNKAALLHGLAGHRSIYKYNFAYRGLFSTSLCASLKNYGVSHSDELRYLFQWWPFNIKLPYSSEDLEVRDLLLTLWTNFAKFGNPTPSKSVNASDSSSLLENLVWHPIGDISADNHHVRYLNIGQVDAFPIDSLFLNENLGPVKLNMAEDLLKNRTEFWDSLPLSENVPCSIC